MKTSPHGNPKGSGAAATPIPPEQPRPPLVHWIAFRAIDKARKHRIVL